MIRHFQTKLIIVLGVILIINFAAVILLDHYEDKEETLILNQIRKSHEKIIDKASKSSNSLTEDFDDYSATIKEINRLAAYKILLVIFLIIVTITIIAVFLFYWISIPITLLTKGFSTENPEILESIRNDKSEIGKLAGLVFEFFKQKGKLENEIQERIIIEDQLKEVREQLESKVVERTRELSDSNTLLRREIEERKKLEESLQEFQNRLQLLAETTGDVLYRLKYDSMKYDYVNPAIKILTGYTQDEINEIGFGKIIIKKELHDLPHNSNYVDLKHFDIDRFTTEYTADYLILRKDGLAVWVGDHSYPWKDEMGKVIGSVGVLQDISKRKVSELIIKRHDAILKSISDEAEIFLKTSKWEDRITEILKGLGEAAEVSRVYIFKSHKASNYEFLQSYAYEWCAQGIAPQIKDASLQNISSNHPAIKSSIQFLSKNKAVFGLVKDFPDEEKKYFGRLEIKSLLNVPILVEKELWGFIGFDDSNAERIWTSGEIEALRTAADILSAVIQKNNFELELVKAKDKAEKSDQLKTDFLTQMSHEIRTPLNTILNYASLIKDEIDCRSFETLPLFFDIISEAGKRLTRTIDLILNMSQIQTGSYEPNFRVINLEKDILNQVINEYCIHAQKKGIKLNFINNASDTKIKGDNYTVTQIFDNIVNNAVKYTANGSIDVFVYSLNGSICVDIKDTGIGILKEYLPNLFTPFSQEEMGYTRRFDGNGLGLALVKKYIDLNKGEISVNSEKGIGSVFTIKFNKLNLNN